MPAIPARLLELTPADRLQLEAWLAEFDEKWDENCLESRVERLPPRGQPLRLPALIELVKIDLEKNWQCGRQLGLVDYVARYPELGAPEALPPDLVLAEEEVCRQFGDLSATVPSLSAGGVPSLPTLLQPAPPAKSRVPCVRGYEVLGKLGQGAMGAVYKAHHLRLNRVVALKVVLDAPSARPEELVRFRREAELIARLQHANIVQIYEVGEYACGSYLALEYVDGPTLDRQLSATPQPPREAARLIEVLARAVHYAHGQSVIHRDLKPGNVLLTAAGAPKIADFGLARHTEGESGLTTAGTVMGTPNYMAPEQADGRLEDICPHTDTYALGAILYECLTGRPPFQGATVLDTLAKVREQEPVPPHRLLGSTNRSCPADLETICLKCLEKDPHRRYASAGALADDLGRYLAGEPIAARPVGPAGRAWRWARRNPRVAGLLLAVAASLLLGTVAATLFAVRAERNAHRAQEQLWRAMLNEARGIRMSGRRGQRFDALAKLREAMALARRQGPLSAEDRDRFRTEASACLVLPDVEVEKEWEGWPPGSNEGICLDPSLRFYARSMLTEDQVVTIRRLADDTELARLSGDGPNVALDFSADGRRLLRLLRKAGRLQCWSLEGAGPALVWQRAGVSFVYFHPKGGSVIAGLPTGAAVLLDAATGREQQRLPQGTINGSDAFHPTLPRVVVSQGTEARVVDLESGRVVFSDTLPGGIDAVAWHPAGRTLALRSGPLVQLYDGTTGRKLRTLQGQQHSGMVLRFDPSGELLVSREWSGLLRFWDPLSGRQLFSAPANMTNLVVHSRSGQDGWTLGSEIGGSRVRLLHVPTRSLHTLAADVEDLRWSALSPDGRWLVYRSRTAARWHDLTGRAEPGTLPAGALPLRFDPSGRALLALDRQGLVRWPFDPGAGKIGPPERLHASTVTDAWGISRDQQTIAIPMYAGGAQIWHRDRPEYWTYVPRQHDVRHVAVSPDGRWVVTGSHVSGTVTVSDAGTGRQVKHLLEQGGWAVFSPDGHWLAVAAFTGGGRLWCVDGWEPGADLGERYFAFGPDSQLVAVGGGYGVLRLLECATGREVARLEVAEQTQLFPCHFTPDGGRLLVEAYELKSILAWDLRALRAELKGLDLDWDWPEFPPAPVTPVAGPDKIEVLGADLLSDPEKMARHIRRGLVEAVQKDPLDPVAQARLGGFLLREKRHLEGLLRLSLALWLRPDLLDARCSRGQVLLRLGLDRLAAADATRALRQSPGYTRALDLRVRAYQRLGRHRELVDDLTVLIEYYPGDEQLYELRAAGYARLGRTAEARADRREAEELTPTDPERLNALAWELLTRAPDNRDPARAVELARKAVQLAPQDAMIRDTLGVALCRAGRYQEAIAELGKSLETGKGDGQNSPFDLFTLALCHARLGDQAKASDCFQRAVGWLHRHPELPAEYAEELKAFRVEAESLLGAGEKSSDASRR
jgi:WD40 repeat protein/tetratricopeptide (TPR) repeat protein